MARYDIPIYPDSLVMQSILPGHKLVDVSERSPILSLNFGSSKKLQVMAAAITSFAKRRDAFLALSQSPPSVAVCVVVDCKPLGLKDPDRAVSLVDISEAVQSITFNVGSGMIVAGRIISGIHFVPSYEELDKIFRLKEEVDLLCGISFGVMGRPPDIYYAWSVPESNVFTSVQDLQTALLKKRGLTIHWNERK